MRLPNGYGSVHKLSGKRRNPWRVRKTIGYDDNGKPLYFNIGYYPTRKDALEKLAEYNNNPWDVNAKKTTFDDIFQIIMSKKKKELSKSSIQGFIGAYNYLEPIKNMYITDIKLKVMQDIIDGMLDKSISTRRNVRRAMVNVFDYAMKNELIVKDYASMVYVGKPNQKREINIFTNDEIRELIKRDGFNHDITKLLIFTGFRINELLGLQTGYVNLDEGYMVGGSKTEAGKDRIVPISKHILPIVELLYNPENPYLITNAEGNRYTADGYRYHWQQDYPNHRFHECRHTFSSLCGNSDMKKLSHQMLMGHSARDITDRVYTHKTIDDLKLAMRQFDDYVDTILCI